MIKVAHLSTAHGRRDIRIYLKECRSIASNESYDVHYFVADGLGDEFIGGIIIHDIGKSGGRFKRMLLRPWKMLGAARNIKAQIYHLHDPELLLIALFLQIGGGVVIYDSHEDTPRSLLSREWIPAWIRPSLSKIFERFEDFVVNRISGVIGATPSIEKRFHKINQDSEVINNYPLVDEIGKELVRLNYSRNVCYFGAISKIRGIEEMVRSLEHVNAKLILAGVFEDAQLENKVRSFAGWSKVDFRGLVSRSDTQKIMAESTVGLVLYHPEPNHIDAQPNKMFEYLAAGMPVIASNFLAWTEFIEGNNFGVCVDPLNHVEIARVINELISNPNRLSSISSNGRIAIQEKYNWNIEEKKLLIFYSRLLNKKL